MRDPTSYDFWRHYVGLETPEGRVLTDFMLRKWAEDPNRMFECIFCQIVEPLSYFKRNHFLACPRCKEYKGVRPHIPDWSEFA